MSTIQDTGTAASTSHRIRSVLAIRPFRRLWGVTYLCSVGDWLSLLALTGLVTNLTESYQWQSFSLSLVVLTQLLPGILFAPLGGVLADRFDRRKIMVACDLLRGGLFISIALVGTAWWLFIANFLVGCCAMLWIPAKDSAVPNLLRRPDQVETANQLGLVMTYGISVISGAGLYSLISGIPGYLHLQSTDLEFRVATIAVMVNGALYVTSAVLVATRIPELSGRVASARRTRGDGAAPGFFAMLRDGLRYAGRTPLVRGLVIGMIGAFAAAGAVIGTAPLYSQSLLGGAPAFGLLFVAVFTGLAVGMALAPRMARRLPHDRLFGVTIVLAGLSLMVVALAPHLWVALVAVALVGGCAGTAFLTGLTIVGSQVEDAMRGRTVALLQSLLKIVLGASTAAAPLLVSVIQRRTVTVLGHPMQVDGTRPVLFGAALVAALLGLIAYRQMDSRRAEPILSGLLDALRGRGRRGGGLLIAVEGESRADTAAQARLLAGALRSAGHEVLLASDPDLDEQRLRDLLSTADLAGVRAHALVAAAVRADVVEREVRPALAGGSLVVMERYVDSPLAHFSAAGTLEPREVEGLVDWATGRLRPDVTVLLDRTPDGDAGPLDAVEHHWRVQRLLTEMASADPERYVVVDADGPVDQVAERVREAVLPLVARAPVRPVVESS
ncbi:bifunctional MFS transporter/dTMP kinase [Saccharothrix algeriensis]|uniref:Thymidylate kinase n=1 Tax=Saccharothrix algeriensis TaxID=173560 RepID=A0A8T8I4U4_9PSEU|nr:dTMP kinase [Saccharothrix algeriensis]MBM7811864.1 dTMP kinase [Saccharothrix algeriensis]QTR05588.1 thymidylate kinase [Saccharothrix algeriensis]